MRIGRGVEFADQCFQQVLLRHQAEHFAVFVDDEHHLLAGVAKEFQQLHAGHRFRQEHAGLYFGSQIGEVVLHAQLQQCLRADQAAQMVKAAVAYRVQRVVVGEHLVDVVFHRVFGIKKINVAARSHQRGDKAVFQPEHLAHHVVFLLLDKAAFGALVQHGVDVFFGEFGIAGGAGAQQPQHGVGRSGQQYHKGPRQRGQQ